jgi:methyl halide transferase
MISTLSRTIPRNVNAGPKCNGRKFPSFFLLAKVVLLCTSSTQSADSLNQPVNKRFEYTNSRWDDIWNAGLVIGERFDVGTPSPALLQLIDKGEIPNGRALVPGCGRGYDVFALASPQRYCLGLDMAEKAIESALNFMKSIPPDMQPPEGQADFKVGSFFDLSEEAQDKYDFIYDYTFLCALDPAIRADWAEKMAALTKPGGELLTLIFPISETKEGGPPFRVSLKLMKDLLEPVGFEPFRLEVLPPELCHEGRDGVNLPKNGRFDELLGSGIGRWRRRS